jgi:hypothetical protein
MASTFKPNQKMAANAKRGLKLRERFNRGGAEVGVRRAQQLAAQSDLDETDVKSMHSYFARHAVDKDGKSHQWDSDTDPSAGFVAWLLWGGDAGKAWADRHARKLDAKKAASPPEAST